MEKNAIHHSPTREYSPVWGNLDSVRRLFLGRDSDDRSPSPESLESPPAHAPESLVATPPSESEREKLKPESSDFFSLTRRQDRSKSEFDAAPGNSDDLNLRLYHLEDRLADYRWSAENDIIAPAADAVVHLDELANQFRAGVRQELENFRNEAGNKSVLCRSMVDSALRRLSSQHAPDDQSHHAPPGEGRDPKFSPTPKTPVFFNYLPRAEKD